MRRSLRRVAGARALAAFALAGATVSAPAAPLAELVAFRTADRVLLHALHYAPAKPSVRAVIHVPGGPGAFASPQDMAPLAAALVADGIHFFSINLRTAGANGMLYAKFEDARQDIAAAVELARRHGITEVVLLGHSLGSARVLHYLAESDDRSVRAVVLTGAITSPYLEAQMRWNEAERARYDAFLREQRRRVADGRGRELAAYPWTPERELELSAATWVNVFGRPDESNASTVKYAGDIALPVLIVHGTADEGALPANAREIHAALRSSPKKELEWIEGANHLFIGHAPEYASIIAPWVTARMGDARMNRSYEQASKSH